MILQALCQHYETLLRLGKLSPPGWDTGFKVSFGLDLSDSGEILDLLDFREMQTRGKKSVLVARSMSVPARVGRSGTNFSANFLCDNAGYMLGADGKGKPKQSLACFRSTGALHHELLDGVDTPPAKAVLSFLDHWMPTQGKSHPKLEEHWKDIIENSNLIFCYNMKPLTEYTEICEAWEDYYNREDPDIPKTQCLITGEVAPVAATHPKIKGVKGAQSSGAALVSYNAAAFCSYGHEQNYNAPISQRAAFAYTAALNALLADREHCRVVGDTTVVCWAEHGSESYQDVAFATMFGSSDGITDEEIAAFLNALARGLWIDMDGIHLNPEEHFYFLGLAPNAARLSVRFFLRDTFGAFLNNIAAHYQDIAIVAPSYDKFVYLPLWKLLGETVNQKSKDKSVDPQLSGDVLRAILTGTPYPATLLNATQMRIRAEHTVTRGRAAIIKSYYLRRPAIPFPREVLTMEGNSASTNIPYTLGRLFSVLEQIQEAANPGLNTTIKDQYFNSASGTPANIFPLLINLAQKHLRVIRRSKPGLAVSLERKIRQYTTILGESYPARLTLPQQGAFQLGYYFETQSRYSGKTENHEIKEED